MSLVEILVDDIQSHRIFPCHTRSLAHRHSIIRNTTTTSAKDPPQLLHDPLHTTLGRTLMLATQLIDMSPELHSGAGERPSVEERGVVWQGVAGVVLSATLLEVVEQQQEHVCMIPIGRAAGDQRIRTLAPGALPIGGIMRVDAEREVQLVGENGVGVVGGRMGERGRGR